MVFVTSLVFGKDMDFRWVFKRLRNRPDCAHSAFAAWLSGSIFGSKIDFSWETSPARKVDTLKVLLMQFL